MASIRSRVFLILILLQLVKGFVIHVDCAFRDDLGRSEGAAVQLVPRRLRGLRAAPVASLATCLSAISKLTYEAPGASNFQEARSVWNLRCLTNPAMVAFPSTVSQISQIVKCGRKYGVKVVPRGGAHSYEGYGVQLNKLTVDLHRINTVTLGAGGIAYIGAGARLGPIYKALWDQGQRTIPAGTCPTVGVGGHVLGGGFGMLARKYGLASDRLIGLQGVDSTGNIVTANKTVNADLLWASQGGGGGNFVIITRFTLATVAVPSSVTFINVVWPASAAASAIQWYLSKFPTLTDSISSDLFVGYGQTELHALYLGAPAAARSLLANAGLGAIGQPVQNQYDAMTYIDAVTQFANQAEALQPVQASSLSLGSGVKVNPPNSFKAHSNFVKVPISAAGANLAAAKIASATSQGLGGWAQFHAYGGALNRVKPADTAFVHRTSLSSVQFYVSWTDASQAQKCTAWLQDFWTSMKPYVSSEAYQNYIDKDLGAGSMAAYYGSNVAKLVAVKKKYDSSGFFSYPFSISAA